MKYYITIDYSSNDNKAGKLTIKSSMGKEILDKAPIVVPNQIRDIINHKGENLVLENYKINNVITELSSELQNFSKYSYDIGVFEKFKLNNILYIDKQYAIINNNDFNKTSDSFVLMNKDYNKLKSLIDSTNVFDIEIRRKFMIFGLKEVGDSDPLLNTSLTLSKLEKAEIELEREKIRIEEAKRVNSEKNLIKDKDLNNGIKSPIISTTSSVKKEEKNLVNSTKPVNNNSMNSYYSSTVVNDLDPLDVLLMYHNPSLAPFFKPNSILAWALYFDHQNSDISLVDMKNNLNEVQGFENVAGSNLKYTSTGYEIQMFDDSDRQELVGTLIYNSKENTYSMKDPSNNVSTSMTMNNNGDVVGSFNGDKGSISYDLVKKPDGMYTGNWESLDNEGIKIVSAVEFDKDLSSSSKPFEPVNVEHIKTSRDEYVEKNDFEYSKKIEEEATLKWEPPPPPPPPPPKEDEYGWSSSNDSYSNSSSFSP